MTENQKELRISCLEKQLDEVDLLSSIYCNPGELKVLDYSTIPEITDFVKGKTSNLSSNLEFIVTLTSEDDYKVEVRIELPHLYPLVETPTISIRSNKYNRVQESAMKGLLQEFIASECDISDSYIFQIISWIQENLKTFEGLGKTNDLTTVKKNENKDDDEILEMERLWIYSHHIKSKTKRRNILQIAKDLALTGFMRSGKPGIICVEGRKEQTQDFWRTIRQWNWQKITVRKIETLSKPEQEENFNLFDTFREYLFTTNEDEEEIPMDMSQFMKFLDAHKCAYIKEYLFSF